MHPHQGFEICSFILKGNINHFDTKQNKWIPLSKGDVQIIRSGNGISHVEEIDKNSEIFQSIRQYLSKLDTCNNKSCEHVGKFSETQKKS